MSAEEDIRDIKNHMIKQTEKQGEILEGLGRLDERQKAMNTRLENGDKAFVEIRSRFEGCQDEHAEEIAGVSGRLGVVEDQIGVNENPTMRQKVDSTTQLLSNWKAIVLFLAITIPTVIGIVVSSADKIWGFVIKITGGG